MIVRGATLDCGGKRQRHAAFGDTQRVRRCFAFDRGGPPEIPSKGGVALTLPTALQGARSLRHASYPSFGLADGKLE